MDKGLIGFDDELEAYVLAFNKAKLQFDAFCENTATTLNTTQNSNDEKTSILNLAEKISLIYDKVAALEQAKSSSLHDIMQPSTIDQVKQQTPVQKESLSNTQQPINSENTQPQPPTILFPKHIDLTVGNVPALPGDLLLDDIPKSQSSSKKKTATPSANTEKQQKNTTETHDRSTPPEKDGRKPDTTAKMQTPTKQNMRKHKNQTIAKPNQDTDPSTTESADNTKRQQDDNLTKKKGKNMVSLGLFVASAVVGAGAYLYSRSKKKAIEKKKTEEEAAKQQAAIQQQQATTAKKKPTEIINENIFKNQSAQPSYTQPPPATTSTNLDLNKKPLPQTTTQQSINVNTPLNYNIQSQDPTSLQSTSPAPYSYRQQPPQQQHQQHQQVYYQQPSQQYQVPNTIQQLPLSQYSDQLIQQSQNQKNQMYQPIEQTQYIQSPQQLPQSSQLSFESYPFTQTQIHPQNATSQSLFQPQNTILSNSNNLIPNNYYNSHNNSTYVSQTGHTQNQLLLSSSPRVQQQSQPQQLQYQQIQPSTNTQYQSTQHPIQQTTLPLYSVGISPQQQINVQSVPNNIKSIYEHKPRNPTYN